ncbi:MAG: hypothetical protein WCD81_10375 [Candidatus Bathyarchaeia archaeon]
MSSDKALEILVDLADALEAAAVKVKHEVAQLQGLQKEPAAGSAAGAKGKSELDLSRIPWQAADGSKGPYEQADDPTNPVFQELTRILAEHKGKMRVGPYFVWKFTDGTKIGRKKAQ